VYSSLFGIPVALIGIVGYLALLGLATVWGKREETPRMLLLASLAGLGFALYLTYIEGFVLATWCILCLTSLTLILTIAVLSAVMMRVSNRAEGRHEPPCHRARSPGPDLPRGPRRRNVGHDRQAGLSSLYTSLTATRDFPCR